MTLSGHEEIDLWQCTDKTSAGHKFKFEVSMISRRLCIAVLFIGAFPIPQPGFSAENWPDAVDEYVAQVRETIGTIDMDGFLTVVKNPKGARLVDVREPSEFNAGHVPGAVNAPRSRLEHQIWSALGYPDKVDMNGKIHVVCQRGARATFAAKQLKDIGFTNLTIVVMNLDDWQKKAIPSSKAM